MREPRGYLMRDETLLPGMVFAGRFRIEAELGRGGMGVVYAVTDVLTERDVALKVIAKRFARDPDFVERFKRECKAVAALAHENIVRLYEANMTPQGDWYLVMERLEGLSLRELLKTAPAGRLSVPHATHIVLQLVDALSVAHAKGIWHRDIKPENGFVGEKSRFWLLDFGLAKRANAGTQTDEQRPMGTHRYLPPEVVHGKARPDGRADVYQVGIVYFEMLTGRSPYPVLDDPDARVTDIQAAHAFMDPTPLREILPDAPARAEAVISRCLMKAREARYQTAKSLGDDLFAVILDVLPPNHPIAVQGARHRAGSSDLWPKVTLPPSRPAFQAHERAARPAFPEVPVPRSNPQSRVPTLRGLPGPTSSDGSLDRTAVAVAPIVAVGESEASVIVRDEPVAPSHAVTAPIDPTLTPPDASPPWLTKPQSSRSDTPAATSIASCAERTANGTEKVRLPDAARSHATAVRTAEPPLVSPPPEARAEIAIASAEPPMASVTWSAHDPPTEEDAQPQSAPESLARSRFVRVRFVPVCSESTPARDRASQALIPPSVALVGGRWKPRRDRAERMASFVVKALAGPDAEPLFPDLPPEALVAASTPTARRVRSQRRGLASVDRRSSAARTPAPSLAARRSARGGSGKVPLFLAVLGGFVMAVAGVAFALRMRAPGSDRPSASHIAPALAEDPSSAGVTPTTAGLTRPASVVATERPPAGTGSVPPTKQPRPRSTATSRPVAAPQPKAVF